MQYQPYFVPQFQQRPPSGRVEFNWISESFELFKRQAIVWIVTTLIVIFGSSVVIMPFQIIMQIQMVQSMQTMGTMTPGTPMATQQILAMYGRVLPMMAIEMPIMMVVYLFLVAGMLRMAIMQVQGLQIQAGDVFKGWRFTPRLLGLYLIMFVVNVVIAAPLDLLMYLEFKTSGTVPVQEVYLLVVAFLLFFVVLGTLSAMILPAFVLIADGETVFTAIQRSFTAIKQDWIRGCLLLFTFFLLYMGSAMCFLGIFVTVPMAVLMLALCYRDMMEMPAPAFVPPPPINQQQHNGVWPPPPGQQ
jgi:hypothetical protein